MDGSEACRKEEDFYALHLLEANDDSDVQESSQQALLNMKLPLVEDAEITGSRAIRPPRGQPLARSRSSPVPGPKVTNEAVNLGRRSTEPSQPSFPIKARSDVIVIEDTPSDEEHSSGFNEKPILRTVPPTHRGVPCRVAGEKRKRDNEIPLPPVEQRLFKDCSLFFFPNNDSNIPRRVRMVKAVERGATWVKTWHFNVSHVVVDSAVTYSELMRELKLSQLPEHVVLVNDMYTTNCIHFRALLNPSQPLYRVKEAPTPAKTLPKAVPPAQPQPASDTSLKAKSSNIRRARQVETTPDRSSVDHTNSEDGITPAHAPIAQSKRHVHGQTDQERLSPLAASRTQRPLLPAKRSSNDLSRAIAEAKATAHLPLDLDNDSEEGDSTLTSRPTSASSTEVPAWQKHFQCMQDPSSRPSSSSGPNAHTIDLLQQMGNYYDSIRDQWRSRAFRIAISQLRRTAREIATAEEAIKLRGVGQRLADKIEEIYNTSRLQRLENALLEPEDKALKRFLGIYGVGFVQAQAWVRQGLRSLDDIKKRKIPLTKNQQIGLERYADLNTRIPRAEVTKLGEVVINALKHIDSAFEVMIGGSYRRGSESSGDIDLIITHPTNTLVHTRTIVLETLVPRLETNKFLVARLAVTSRDDGTKWHGACVLPPSKDRKEADQARPWRRIDLLLVPSDEMGAAVLYFTGNDIFNRSMRLLARKKGMRLNQRGLYKDVIRTRGNAGEKLTEGTKIAGRYERDIFNALSVPWRECTERDC